MVIWKRFGKGSEKTVISQMLHLQEVQ